MERIDSIEYFRKWVRSVIKDGRYGIQFSLSRIYIFFAITNVAKVFFVSNVQTNPRKAVSRLKWLFCKAWLLGWVDDLRFYALFDNISVISGRLLGDNE